MGWEDWYVVHVVWTCSMRMERVGTSPIGDDVEDRRGDFVLCAVVFSC